MNPSLLFRLQPTGPWPAPGGGASLLGSDTLYAALTAAAAELGWVEEWLEATSSEEAGESPAIRCTSLFPWQERGGRMLFAPPPANLWPYAGLQRLRPALVRYLPMGAIAELCRNGALTETNWSVDAWSGCLLPADRAGQGGPYRPGQRSRTAVDRHSGEAGLPQAMACLEFSGQAGVWGAVVFSDPFAQEWWSQRVQQALRWLADTGVGAWRTSGWGAAEIVEMQEGPLAELLFGRGNGTAREENGGRENGWRGNGGRESRGKNVQADGHGVDEADAFAEAVAGSGAGVAGTGEAGSVAAESGEFGLAAGLTPWWTLSLCLPREEEPIVWEQGAYRAIRRQGRATATGQRLPATACLVEGSVLVSEVAPVGSWRSFGGDTDGATEGEAEGATGRRQVRSYWAVALSLPALLAASGSGEGVAGAGRRAQRQERGGAGQRRKGAGKKGVGLAGVELAGLGRKPEGTAPESEVMPETEVVPEMEVVPETAAIAAPVGASKPEGASAPEASGAETREQERGEAQEAGQERPQAAEALPQVNDERPTEDGPQESV